MSIGINTNYGTNGYVGLNSSADPAWIKDDDKEKEKASSAAQPGVIYEKQDANAKAAKSEKDDEKAIYKKSKEDREAIVQQLKAAEEFIKGKKLHVAITGSAGLGVAKARNIPIVQEV